MINLQAILIVLVAAVLIAVADAFLKQAAVSGNYWVALKTPWVYGSLVLYLAQILLTVYYFLKHWELSITANLFLVFYSAFSIVIGILFFQEKLSVTQVSGIALGLIAVFLMTK